MLSIRQSIRSAYLNDARDRRESNGRNSAPNGQNALTESQKDTLHKIIDGIFHLIYGILDVVLINCIARIFVTFYSHAQKKEKGDPWLISRNVPNGEPVLFPVPREFYVEAILYEKVMPWFMPFIVENGDIGYKKGFWDTHLSIPKYPTEIERLETMFAVGDRIKFAIYTFSFFGAIFAAASRNFEPSLSFDQIQSQVFNQCLVDNETKQEPPLFVSEIMRVYMKNHEDHVSDSGKKLLVDICAKADKLNAKINYALRPAAPGGEAVFYKSEFVEGSLKNEIRNNIAPFINLHSIDSSVSVDGNWISIYPDTVTKLIKETKENHEHLAGLMAGLKAASKNAR